MANDKKQFTLEKIEKLLDKHDIPEAIEIWKESGDKLHAKIQKKKEEHEQYLKSLKN